MFSLSVWHILIHLQPIFQSQVEVQEKNQNSGSGIFWSCYQFGSLAQSCPTLCDPMNLSTPGLPVHYQLPEFTQTHVHRVGGAIQPSHPLLSPSPPAPNPSQHRVFSNESTLRIRRPKYWSFSFSISPSSENPGLISFRSWNELGLLLCRKRYNPTKEELVLRYSSSFILGIFLLEYNCFIIFVSFSSTMKWISHTYTISSPSWISPLLPNATSLGHHIALSRAPCAYSSFPLAIYFTHGSSCVSPNLPVCPTLLFPPCSHVHGFHLPVYFPSLLILVISCITAKKYLLSTHHRPPAVIGAGDTVVHRQTRFLLPCG